MVNSSSLFAFTASMSKLARFFGDGRWTIASRINGASPYASSPSTMELLEDPRELEPVDFWQYQVITDSFADGYGQCQATVWDDRGRPVALSRQTVVVFG